jgi:hypothetical protein
MADIPLSLTQETEAQQLFETLQQAFLAEARQLARLLAARTTATCWSRLSVSAESSAMPSITSPPNTNPEKRPRVTAARRENGEKTEKGPAGTIPGPSRELLRLGEDLFRPHAARP